MAEQIGNAASADKLPEKYRQLLSGHAITLDVRSYGRTVAELFSAVIDAMTNLNIPVDSVDSPNGVITSDWIGKGENDLTMPGIKGYTRHRFMMRIYRSGVKSGDISRLEVRVLGQVYENRRWLDKTLVRNMSGELFVAVDEQLTRMKTTALPIESTN